MLEKKNPLFLFPFFFFFIKNNKVSSEIFLFSIVFHLFTIFLSIIPNQLNWSRSDKSTLTIKFCFFSLQFSYSFLNLFPFLFFQLYSAIPSLIEVTLIKILLSNIPFLYVILIRGFDFSFQGEGKVREEITI